MPSDLSNTIRSAATHPRRKWFIIVVIIAGIAGITWFFLNRGAKDDSAPAYNTEPLRRADLSIVITATGNLEPTNQVTVGSELSGTVLEVFVDINDQVTKGQKLARLDTSKLTQQTERTRATLAAAKASVSQAEATVREARANLDRLQELHRISDGRTPSKAELEAALATSDRAAADLASALASVAENEAAVRANESDLTKSIITSPVDGIVLTRQIEPGQTVAAQFTAPELFIIAESLETMELKVAVAEADIGKVAKDQSAAFTVDAWPDRSYTATVKRVSFGSTITDNVVTYSTELAVENKDRSLRPGMTATVDITTAGRTQVLLVPTAALRFKPRDPNRTNSETEKKSFVQSLIPTPRRRTGGQRPTTADEPRKLPGEGQIWILKEGKPFPISVKTGLSDGRHTEISSDELKENMPVIIRQTNSSAFEP